MQPDEASFNYGDILRNFRIGKQFLRDEFGVETKIGWQLDPFGHSSGLAKLYQDMGMEALVFARVNKETHDEMKKNKTLEFVW